ncbi:restriction endonuclease subunit S [Acinetobacter indicus]|uniref:restriction endonuclease subunit S n=1 Tax=Acinetobacter indicus TaxID=756892 RepID=UPI001266599D|nr:restriction endonuclease subunit S [Acinetobacter indicus]QFS18196.1 restriction endonuclease subunit S [Acinetobacter indicus]
MSEWQACTLSDVLKFGNGKSRPKEYGTIPVYGGNGILDYTNSSNYQDETIVIGRVGAYCGATYYEDKQIWVSDNALSAKALNRNDAKFLYYFLKNLDLNQFAQGSSHPLLTQTLLNSIEVVVPSSPLEQKAIASVLSSLDDKIDLFHRQNKTLEAMAETLFRQWFIEEAKEDWEQATLKDEFSFTMGQSPSGSSFNEDSVGTPMFQGNADFGFRFPKERVYTTEPVRFAYPLDTLISVRAPVGAQNMAKVECCIGRGVAAFRHAKNPQWYTYTYYKLNQLMNQIKQFNDEGTVFGSISKSDFERLEVVIPPDEAILAYEQTAKPLNDKIIANVEQIQTLENLRDTLLPKLMSGEVRVQYQTEEVA